jgi:hypothetical protein
LDSADFAANWIAQRFAAQPLPSGCTTSHIQAPVHKSL